MARFELAVQRLLAYEGGYSNHPIDRGGETFYGISRRWYPEWDGWRLVDAVKVRNGSFTNDDIDTEIHQAVLKFYHDNYWVKINGDKITVQEIADELLEVAVNVGIIPAVRFLQEACNLLNRNGKLYADIKVDGKIGAQTLAMVEQCIKRRGVYILLNLMNLLQAEYYIEILRRHPEQEEFVLGWLNRIDIVKG